MMQIVHNRVDALVLAFRTRLTKDAYETIKERSRIAYAHGRAAIKVAGLDWEIRYSRTPRRWNLIRQDHVRAMVDLCAPGATISYQSGFAYVRDTEDLISRQLADESEIQDVIDTSRDTDEPGWTLELVFYAQYLADHPLAKVIGEARALASSFGRVFEERVRRLDLACDVAGFRVRERDRCKLVTRSAIRLDPKKTKEVEIARTDDVGSGVLHARRTITGITVGKNHLMCRMYDKQEELRVKINEETDKVEKEKLHAKAVREVERWMAGGWNGKDPVTRVEFQLRGEALRSLGVKKADGIIEPIVMQLPGMTDGATGEVYSLVDYVPRIFASCIQWVRLVVPTRSKSGVMKQKTRWRLDARWKVLHRAVWPRSCSVHPEEKCACVRRREDAVPIKRVRSRSPVSSAQAVGAMASLVAAKGELPSFDESEAAYKENPTEKLVSMLRTLCAFGIDQIAVDLISRWGGPEQAALHLAIRLNAARARFALARAGPRSETEIETTWPPSGQLESGKHEHSPSTQKMPRESFVTDGERAARQTILNWGSS